MIANADGTGEQKLAQRQFKEAFDSSPAWSPDGKVIACAAMIADKGFSMNVFEIQVEGGAMKPISEKAWAYINDIAWLRDCSGVVTSF